MHPLGPKASSWAHSALTVFHELLGDGGEEGWVHRGSVEGHLGGQQTQASKTGSIRGWVLDVYAC